MTSRIEKYYQDDSLSSASSMPTRSSRNSRLYKEVYGKYGNVDNLPLEDNTDEIDMEKLKELVLNNQNNHEMKELKENLNILEQKRRKIDEQKIYDINKILEKAKYENSKLKEPAPSITKVNKDILSTLENIEGLGPGNWSEKGKEVHKKVLSKESEQSLSMTRELKYQNLTEESVVSELQPSSSSADNLSLDLFEDLKPTGNTITTEPIAESSSFKGDIHSPDTRDIDIIKPDSKALDNDFFTSSYEFSKKDFTSDDDFYDLPQKGGILKIILLMLAIMVFVGVIVYFVWTYGMGIS